VDSYDVGMLESGRSLGFTAEPLHERLAPGELSMEDLGGDAPAQPLVLGDIDIGHAAAGEVRNEGVPSSEDVLRFHDRWNGTGDPVSCS